jgi:hypothetical protein
MTVAGLLLASVLATRRICAPGHARDVLDLLGRPVLHFLADEIHPPHALADVFLVLPAVLEDVPQQAPNQGDVRAGAEADILSGMRGGSREARVADDERRVVLLLGLEQVLQRYGMRLGGVAADEEHRLRLHDVVVGVRHGAVAPRVRDARDRGGVADARLVVDVVGAPERREFAEQIRLLVGVLGRAHPVDRILPRGLADLQHLVADLVDGDIPADACPLSGDELHGILEPTVAMRMLARGRALGTVGAQVERAVEAGLPGRSTRRSAPRP